MEVHVRQCHPLAVALAHTLVNVGGELIESNGSATLRFLDPETLHHRRHVKVRMGKDPLPGLNELEAAHDRILANVYGADWIAEIDPGTGCVRRTIDLSSLRSPETNDPFEAKCAGKICVNEDFVLNGIAFDEAKGDLYITGKNWPYIYVFKFPK